YRKADPVVLIDTQTICLYGRGHLCVRFLENSLTRALILFCIQAWLVFLYHGLNFACGTDILCYLCIAGLYDLRALRWCGLLRPYGCCRKPKCDGGCREKCFQ